jgi:hypothetical protein
MHARAEFKPEIRLFIGTETPSTQISPRKRSAPKLVSTRDNPSRSSQREVKLRLERQKTSSLKLNILRRILRPFRKDIP